jgi:hypothetical protein
MQSKEAIGDAIDSLIKSCPNRLYACFLCEFDEIEFEINDPDSIVPAILGRNWGGPYETLANPAGCRFA